MIGSSARIQVNDLNDMQNHLREQVYAGAPLSLRSASFSVRFEFTQS